MKTTLDNAMALIHAAETGVEATHWLCGANAIDMLRDAASHQGLTHALSAKRTLFGVDLQYDADLPRLRVALMAGQHTVGAFTCGVAE